MHFADNLVQKIKEKSCIVVGIDPNFEYLYNNFLPKSNSFEDIETALLNFSKQVIDATFDLTPAIKIQFAYFEQFGLAGLTALKKTIDYAKQKNLLIILDAKRGDIGTTSKAYANAYLAESFEISSELKFKSDFVSDSLTINPFLGFDSIEPFIETAIENQKGLFILVKTSNPGSNDIQNLKTKEDQNVSEFLAKKITEWNQKSIGKSGYGLIGAVVGSTFPLEAKKIRSLMPNSILLVPGTGSQGGSVKTALASFDNNKNGAIIPISRAITYPSLEEIEEKNFQQAVRNRLKKFIKEFENQ